MTAYPPLAARHDHTCAQFRTDIPNGWLQDYKRRKYGKRPCKMRTPHLRTEPQNLPAADLRAFVRVRLFLGVVYKEEAVTSMRFWRCALLWVMIEAVFFQSIMCLRI